MLKFAASPKDAVESAIRCSNHRLKEIAASKAYYRQFKKDRRTRTPRAWELDFLRGLAFLYMVFDHMMYLVGSVFRELWASQGKSDFLQAFASIGAAYHGDNPTSQIFRFLFCALPFVVISGICSAKSKHGFQRGLLVLGLGFLLTLVTYLFSQALKVNMTIRFGILHMLGLSMMLGHFFSKLSKFWVLIIGIALIAIGYLNRTVTVSDMYFLPILNFYNPLYVSADYYPLLPYFGYYMLGIFLGKSLYAKRYSISSSMFPVGAAIPVQAIGKRTLLFYFLHFVVLFVGLFIFGALF